MIIFDLKYYDAAQFQRNIYDIALAQPLGLLFNLIGLNYLEISFVF